LTAWISIWIGFFLSLTRQLKHIPKNSLDYAIALGSGAAVIAFLVAGMFENNFYDSETTILMYFIMALPFVSSNGSQSAPSEFAAPFHSGGDLHGSNPAQGS